MKIFLEEVSEIQLEDDIILENYYTSFLDNFKNSFTISEEDYLKLSEDNPIKKVAKPLKIQMINGDIEIEYIFYSRTICESQYLNPLRIQTKYRNLCEFLYKERFVNKFNNISELVFKGYFSKELLEKYNENCYFLVN